MNPLAWLLSRRLVAALYFCMLIYMFISLSPQAAITVFVITYGFISWANRVRVRFEELNPRPAHPPKKSRSRRQKKKETPPPILFGLVAAPKSPQAAPRHGNYYVDMIASLPAPLFELIRSGMRETASRPDQPTA